MSNDNKQALITAAVAIASAFMLAGVLIGDRCATDSERQRAIKAGVAHWTIDPVTGEKRFEYKVKP